MAPGLVSGGARIHGDVIIASKRVIELMLSKLHDNMKRKTDSKFSKTSERGWRLFLVLIMIHNVSLHSVDCHSLSAPLKATVHTK